MSKITFDNPSILRWKPDYKYQEIKLCEHSLDNFKSKDSSITDKEAYRVTLASLRGELSQGAMSNSTGSFSLKPGQEYDYRIDFSYLNRPDVSIVDVDNYIENMRQVLKSLDKDLEIQLSSELKEAEKVLSDRRKSENQSSDSKETNKD